MAVRYLLWGDGGDPQFLMWAQALAEQGPTVFDGFELWAASSRGFLTGFEVCVPEPRRLALGSRPTREGSSAALMLQLPKLARWLKPVQPDWLHVHGLGAHGALAWLAQRLYGVCGRMVGSPAGMDHLHAPRQSLIQRALVRRVLAACTVTTSDSRHRASRMSELGATEVLTFPFGPAALPVVAGFKDDRLFLANGALERPQAPERVLAVFAGIHAQWRGAQLVVANDGAMRESMERTARALGLAGSVHFLGHLDASTQAHWYNRARWYLSLPIGDSPSAPVLDAMAHGCIPILSDLPAHRELVDSGRNGLVLADSAPADTVQLQRLAESAQKIAAATRDWIAERALFAPAVRVFLERLKQLAQ